MRLTHEQKEAEYSLHPQRHLARSMVATELCRSEGLKQWYQPRFAAIVAERRGLNAAPADLQSYDDGGNCRRIAWYEAWANAHPYLNLFAIVAVGLFGVWGLEIALWGMGGGR